MVAPTELTTKSAKPRYDGRKNLIPGANPGGRPKGLMHLVRERTDEGKVLVEIALKIARKQIRGTTRDRLAAVEWLADRGFGKSIIPVEMSGPGGGPIEIASASLAEIDAELKHRQAQLPSCAMIIPAQVIPDVNRS